MAMLNISEAKSSNISEKVGEEKETGVNIEMTHSVVIPIGSSSEKDEAGVAESSNAGNNAGQQGGSQEPSVNVTPADIRIQTEVQVEAAAMVDENNNESFETMCRICRDGSGEMETMRACICKGSMGLFHPRCLEQWLFESGRRTCEICHENYIFAAESRYTGLSLLSEWWKTSNFLEELVMWINTLIPLVCLFAICLVWISSFRSQGYPNGELSSYFIAGAIIMLTVFVVMAIAFACIWCGCLSLDEFRNWMDWKAKFNVIWKVLPITASEVESKGEDQEQPEVVVLQPEPTIRDHGIGIQA